MLDRRQLVVVETLFPGNIDTFVHRDLILAIELGARCPTVAGNRSLVFD